MRTTEDDDRTDGEGGQEECGRGQHDYAKHLRGNTHVEVLSLPLLQSHSDTHEW